ncbi:MAG: hypothetical protein QOD84_993 [Acidobacteriaceae bacterium]
MDGFHVRYMRGGSGRPLVLVHGLLGYSFSWRWIAPVLSRHATVYAPDMLGSGFSDHPADLDYFLRASAERLLRFLDTVGVEACDILGTSYGGAIAMAAAAMAPGRFRSLVLAAPVNPWSSSGSYRAALLGRWPVAALLKRIGPRFHLLDAFILSRLYGDRTRIRPGTLEGYAAAFRTRSSFESPLYILRQWDRDLKQLRTMIPRIGSIPTLLIWGDKDAAVDPRSAGPLQKQFENCQTVILHGVGHVAYEEVPEEFSSIVVQYLSKPE